MEYASPKGVFDILPEVADAEEAWRLTHYWHYVEGVMRATAAEYGFREMRTPIFERTELFLRSVGETSDIVSKEMYTFEDKGSRSLSLRPELTAPVIRSFVENRLYTTASLHKYYYMGPVFRYERSQAGRYRQHHQFGAEVIGIAAPEQDVEVIDMIYQVYKRLGLKNLTVSLNCIGDGVARALYEAALQEFLRPAFDKLSDDSKQRFSKNILRILDSKNPQDQQILENAPSILDFLNDDYRAHFERVQELLRKIAIPFAINSRLVRGLDYYNKTVFEILAGELGAQNAIVGGGRYDKLVSDCGGPSLPAVGFGSGIERVLQTMIKQGCHFPPAPHPLLFLIPMGEKAMTYCFELLCKLRHEKIPCEIDLSGKKIQHGLQLANTLGAAYCLIIGDEELATQKAKVKKMATRESEELSLPDIASWLKKINTLH